MTKLYEAAVLAQASLPTAESQWSVGNFLENAKSTIQDWGGLLLMLLGAVGLIWGGVLLIKKLMANPQTQGQQTGWGTIALLVIVGGALAGGGWSLMDKVGSGGEDTILELGKGGSGTVIVENLNLLLTSGLLG